MIELSIVYSFKCDLNCTFCMYNSSKEVSHTMNLKILKNFIKTIDWKQIKQIGIFGGEISLFINEYEKILSMIPSEVKIMCITNGTWSLNKTKTKKFLSFINKFRNIFLIKISNTNEHNKYQNKTILKEITENDNRFIIKKDDTKNKLLPMGRLNLIENNCTKTCLLNEESKRYTIFPNFDIMYQSCDGKNPIIGNIKNKNFNDLKKMELKCIYLNN